MNDRAETDDIAVTMTRIGRAARDAARRLARISAEQKRHALLTAADRLRADSAVILNANETDVAAAHEHGLAHFGAWLVQDTQLSHASDVQPLNSWAAIAEATAAEHLRLRR